MSGDVIYTNMPTRGEDAAVPNVQYFWEAFPSGSGPTDRTTYLFTYIDADPSRCRVRLALASICMQGFPGIPYVMNVKPLGLAVSLLLGSAAAADEGILLLPRPSLEALLEEYWDLMPEYQGVKLESLEVLRILFGFFPTYRKAQITIITTHDQPL